MKNKEQWKATKFSFKGDRMEVGKNIRYSSRVMVHAIAQHYNELIPNYAQGDLLDLGCGQVPMYQAYKDRVDSICCVDWGSSVHQNIHLDQEMDLNETLDLDSNRFDTVILSDVLEHIAKPRGLMLEIHRVLRPGGHLLMNVPFFYALHEQPFDYHRYTRYALELMAEEAGLKIVELKVLGGWLESTTDLIGKALYAVPLIGKWMALALYWVVRSIGQSSWGRRMAKKTGMSFPYGYSMVAQKSK
jgi:2-polyprenyl-3-methyl-5-hydroxy-6-metoxy-1,4-benzoquinol methylase